ncbi:uncharacterized protein LOC126336106 [Schistocerca gregaria]|uniref:uncharacterized protein LOC126336106 n=1 Tax=Schistocerca gregaria TaxID=7010 RepID=UPI00211E3627|nr:uncharacterized protein LOC126336106 [Schistocerca gregaria]
MPPCHSAHDVEVSLQDQWAALPQDIRCIINSMLDSVSTCTARNSTRARRRAEHSLRTTTSSRWCSRTDVFTRYGVDCYLTALGLSVDPEYRGQGVGEQLLRARWDLCRALGIPLTVTWFSATASQVLAERIGFEVLAEVPYAEYDDPDIKRSSTPITKLMAARIT